MADETASGRINLRIVAESECGDSTSDSSKIHVGPKGFVKIRIVLKKRKDAVGQELLLLLRF